MVYEPLSYFRLLGFAVVSLLLSGCQSQTTANAFEDYLVEAPAGTFMDSEGYVKLRPFMDLFTQLNAEQVEQKFDQVYAEQLYFNDTFHVFHNRVELKTYMANVSEAASTDIKILDVMQLENDYLVRWMMKINTSVAWKSLNIESVGITHVRLNEQGKIVLHQDYWDGVEGFYAHLPVIGSPLKRVRAGLGM